MISIFTIMDRLYREKYWDFEDNVKLSRTEFDGYLIWNGITTNRRKCSELWGILITAPFVRVINQYSILINIDGLVSILARQISKYADIMQMRQARSSSGSEMEASGDTEIAA